MSQTEIRTELHIDAPPSAVWRALTAFEDYAAWNPMVVAASGRAEAGAQATLRYRSSMGVELGFGVRITRAEPERELRWLGSRMGIAGDHYFQLTPTPDGTRMVHGEIFSGPFARAVGFVFRRQIPVFERFNHALAARAKDVAGAS